MVLARRLAPTCETPPHRLPLPCQDATPAVTAQGPRAFVEIGIHRMKTEHLEGSLLAPRRCEGGRMAYTHFERLSALDDSFLEIEDGNSHMHIGAVAVFEGGP